ncbi:MULTISPECIES: YbaY family lipoprotein [unclassified Pseudomonas]|uniref:YbaY family lipoprotein n=1 Tax=unclassified Pseudomonas TaxID=196821 RepID=UPI002AC9584E|nr:MULTISPECIES: YbaY family lipoprotein [unclassified Pseudomonas]MEB0041918.1 YbaY family lipoprotein [Pseudomonas sp. MH10]MEB0076591.1 YbaY family lipoprotein [Pseudomonas sp. MH10out]MEB0090482.1 YbaY family lipoprotein [Pseudomonas sp. CCI4.2]MEB0100679.1 YbaY family lipoprotein [Pseudomonas sp. CCI3.2]MEB0123035.1 YbaY family lipoprotein [Pseudomonas sp. CCI1.2]
MSLRPLALLCLVGLLAACSSEVPKKPVAAKAAIQQPAPVKVQEGLGPLPIYQRELSGQLLGAPPGSQVELALLIIDDRGRPQRLLANITLTGTNQPLPFQLRFNPDSFPVGARVELRGRASQSGQLILHLPSLRIEQGNTQALGALQLLVAP